MTIKQENWIFETINTLNPTEAVRRSYDLGSKGGSKTLKQRDNTASAIASENMNKPYLLEEIRNGIEIAGFDFKKSMRIMKRNLENS